MIITDKNIIENLLYKLILNNIINNKSNYSINSILRGINLINKYFNKNNNNLIWFINELNKIQNIKNENEKDFILGLILSSLDGIYNVNEIIINKYYYKISNYIKDDEIEYNEKYVYLLKTNIILKRLLINFNYDIQFGYNNYKINKKLYLNLINLFNNN